MNSVFTLSSVLLLANNNGYFVILKADWCGETRQGNVCVGSFLKFQKTPGLKPEIRVFGGLFLEFPLKKIIKVIKFLKLILKNE